MLVKAIKTRKLIPPQDDLLSVIKESVLPDRRSSGKGGILKEKSIIVVTSKVVSIWEGNCVEIVSPIELEQKKQKDELIKQEADLWIDRKFSKYNKMLTIKNNILIASGGIDESNANGHYILWPKNPFESAKNIYNFIKKEYKLKNFGVIISDSHTAPLRIGVTGIGIAYYGFCPLRDYRGKKDIFGRKLKVTRTNIVDSLAAAAVYKMGEGVEQTPIAILEDVGNIKFYSQSYLKNNQGYKESLAINIEDDMYMPIIKSAEWQKSNK